MDKKNTGTFTEGLLKMPQQETKKQILKIVLLGGTIEYPVCIQCNQFAAMLDKMGLSCEKRLLDYNNPVHEALRQKSKARGDSMAPMICLEDESGNLELFGAGVWMAHALKLRARERDLQDELQKLVNEELLVSSTN